MNIYECLWIYSNASNKNESVKQQQQQQQQEWLNKEEYNGS